MIIDFFFNKSDIQEEVKKITSYMSRAKKNEAGEDRNEIILEKQDDSIFNTFFNNAESDITDVLSAYLVEKEIEYTEDEEQREEMIYFTLKFPESFSRSMSKSINTEIRNCLTNLVTSQWYLMYLPEYADKYAEMAESNKKNLRFKINKRNKPVMRPFTMFP